MINQRRFLAYVAPETGRFRVGVSTIANPGYYFLPEQNHYAAKSRYSLTGLDDSPSGPVGLTYHASWILDLEKMKYVKHRFEPLTAAVPDAEELTLALLQAVDIRDF